MTSEVHAGFGGAVDDCQKFAWRLVRAYPVTRARPEISRGRGRKTIRRVTDFPCVRADGGLSGKDGPHRCRVHEDRGQPLRQGRSKISLNTLGKGSVLRLYLVTVSSQAQHMPQWRSHE